MPSRSASPKPTNVPLPDSDSPKPSGSLELSSATSVQRNNYVRAQHIATRSSPRKKRQSLISTNFMDSLRRDLETGRESRNFCHQEIKMRRRESPVGTCGPQSYQAVNRARAVARDVDTIPVKRQSTTTRVRHTTQPNHCDVTLVDGNPDAAPSLDEAESVTMWLDQEGVANQQSTVRQRRRGYVRSPRHRRPGLELRENERTLRRPAHCHARNKSRDARESGRFATTPSSRGRLGRRPRTNDDHQDRSFVSSRNVLEKCDIESLELQRHKLSSLLAQRSANNSSGSHPRTEVELSEGEICSDGDERTIPGVRPNQSPPCSLSSATCSSDYKRSSNKRGKFVHSANDMTKAVSTISKAALQSQPGASVSTISSISCSLPPSSVAGASPASDDEGLESSRSDASLGANPTTSTPFSITTSANNTTSVSLSRHAYSTLSTSIPVVMTSVESVATSSRVSMLLSDCKRVGLFSKTKPSFSVIPWQRHNGVTEYEQDTSEVLPSSLAVVPVLVSVEGKTGLSASTTSSAVGVADNALSACSSLVEKHLRKRLKKPAGTRNNSSTLKASCSVAAVTSVPLSTSSHMCSTACSCSTPALREATNSLTASNELTAHNLRREEQPSDHHQLSRLSLKSVAPTMFLMEKARRGSKQVQRTTSSVIIATKSPPSQAKSQSCAEVVSSFVYGDVCSTFSIVSCSESPTTVVSDRLGVSAVTSCSLPVCSENPTLAEPRSGDDADATLQPQSSGHVFAEENASDCPIAAEATAVPHLSGVRSPPTDLIEPAQYMQQPIDCCSTQPLNTDGVETDGSLAYSPAASYSCNNLTALPSPVSPIAGGSSTVQTVAASPEPNPNAAEDSRHLYTSSDSSEFEQVEHGRELAVSQKYASGSQRNSIGTQCSFQVSGLNTRSKRKRRCRHIMSDVLNLDEASNNVPLVTSRTASANTEEGEIESETEKCQEESQSEVSGDRVTKKGPLLCSPPNQEWGISSDRRGGMRLTVSNGVVSPRYSASNYRRRRSGRTHHIHKGEERYCRPLMESQVERPAFPIQPLRLPPSNQFHNSSTLTISRSQLHNLAHSIADNIVEQMFPSDAQVAHFPRPLGRWVPFDESQPRQRIRDEQNGPSTGCCRGQHDRFHGDTSHHSRRMDLLHTHNRTKKSKSSLSLPKSASTTRISSSETYKNNRGRPSDIPQHQRLFRAKSPQTVIPSRDRHSVKRSSQSDCVERPMRAVKRPRASRNHRHSRSRRVSSSKSRQHTEPRSECGKVAKLPHSKEPRPVRTEYRAFVPRRPSHSRRRNKRQRRSPSNSSSSSSSNTDSSCSCCSSDSDLSISSS